MFCLLIFVHARPALADDSMSYIVNGGWRIDRVGEYQLDDVIVLYDRSNEGIHEFVSLRQSPTDLNVFVSISSTVLSPVSTTRVDGPS